MNDPRSSRAWRKAKAQVFATQTICWICGREVDMTLPPEHPDSRSVDHVQPVALGGHMTDRSNLRLSHVRCNKRKGVKGSPAQPRNSRDW